MMPHPERAVNEIIGGADGLKLFKSIVKQWRETTCQSTSLNQIQSKLKNKNYMQKWECQMKNLN